MSTKSWKNHPKKLHTYGSWEFFFLCSPACPKQPRTSFLFYNFFYPTISARISASDACVWTFPAESYAIYCNLLWNCRLIYVVYNFISRRLRRKFENIKNDNFPLTLSVTMVPIYQCNFWRRICLNCIWISVDGKTFYHQKNFQWIWVWPWLQTLWP